MKNLKEVKKDLIFFNYSQFAIHKFSRFHFIL